MSPKIPDEFQPLLAGSGQHALHRAQAGSYVYLRQHPPHQPQGVERCEKTVQLEPAALTREGKPGFVGCCYVETTN